MMGYKKLLVNIPIFLFATLVFSITMAPKGAVVNDEFQYVFMVIFSIIALSLIYIMLKLGDPNRRKPLVILIPVMTLNAVILGTIGAATGSLVGDLIGGHTINFVANDPFREEFHCLGSKRNRFTGWVNNVLDINGKKIKVHGFKPFCDSIAIDDRERKVILSGRYNNIGLIVEKVESRKEIKNISDQSR